MFLIFNIDRTKSLFVWCLVTHTGIFGLHGTVCRTRPRQFLLSPGIRIPWVGTLGSEARVSGHWTVSSQSGQEAPLSWAWWQFFMGHKVRCLTGFLVLWFFFLIDDITCKQTKHDQQMCFTVIYQYAVCWDLWIIARVSSCLLSLEPGNVLWINRWMYPVLSCLMVHNHTG